MAKWSTEYINDLPDSAFMYIEDGGKKDDEGKTAPRSLRHLPYKNHEGNIDLPHVRNALARLDQVEDKDGNKLPDKKKKEIRNKLEKILEDQDDSKKKKQTSKMSADGEGEEDVNDDSTDDSEENKQDTPAPTNEPIKNDDVIDNKKLAEMISQYKKISVDEALNYLESKENPKPLEQNTSQFNASLSEALQLNDDMLSTLEEARKENDALKKMNSAFSAKLEDSHKKISELSTQISQFEQEKKQAKVEEVFTQYCTFFDISDQEKDSVREMMSHMSDDVLEETKKLFSHKKRSTASIPATKPSSMLTQYSADRIAEKQAINEFDQYEKMSPKEKTEFLFDRFVKTNQN